jgi:hypothetical protein
MTGRYQALSASAVDTAYGEFRTLEEGKNADMARG